MNIHETSINIQNINHGIATHHKIFTTHPKRRVMITDVVIIDIVN